MDAVERLTSVKDKLREIEQENITLANENDELRTFSMDGFKIAQSIQHLSGEREKLTSDLADQAKMINHLIDENERLKEKLNGMGNKENRSGN
jgi:regulator of replication initiation timing